MYEELIESIKSNISIPYEYEITDRYYLEKAIRETSNNEPMLEYLTNESKLLMYITVKYENITIRNSQGLSKYLGNVYSIFAVDLVKENIVSVFPELTIRETYKPEDFSNESFYTHSHISPRCYIASLVSPIRMLGVEYVNDGVCFGSSVLGNLAKSCNPLEISTVLVHYKKFLEWESLEGTPYRALSSLKTRDQLLMDSETSISQIINDFCVEEQALLNKLMIETYEYGRHNDRKICMRVDPEVLSILIKHCSGVFYKELVNADVLRDVTFGGIYDIHVEDCSDVSSLENHYNKVLTNLKKLKLMFKGKLIKPKLNVTLEEFISGLEDIKTSAYETSYNNLFDQEDSIVVKFRVKNELLHQYILSSITDNLTKIHKNYV